MGDKSTDTVGDRPRKGPASGTAVEPCEKAPKAYYDVQPNGCWLWNRSPSSKYGITRYGGRYVGAHRAYYAHYRGPVLSGMVVMHLCDTPRCVNPEHLALGTQGENMRDVLAKRRGPWATKVPLTEDDVRDIRAAWKDGESQASIGRRYNRDSSTICELVNGGIWSDVS